MKKRIPKIKFFVLAIPYRILFRQVEAYMPYLSHGTEKVSLESDQPLVIKTNQL